MWHLIHSTSSFSSFATTIADLTPFASYFILKPPSPALIVPLIWLCHFHPHSITISSISSIFYLMCAIAVVCGTRQLKWYVNFRLRAQFSSSQWKMPNTMARISYYIHWIAAQSDNSDKAHSQIHSHTHTQTLKPRLASLAGGKVAMEWVARYNMREFIAQ